MHLHAGSHKVVEFLGMAINMDTIISTWITFAIVFFIFWLALRNPKIVPGYAQNIVESVLDVIMNQIDASLGKKAGEATYVLLTFFIFILVSNELGLFPNGHAFASPTNDLNTTLALALCTTTIVWFMALKIKGMDHIKHLFQPFKVFVIIHLMEEFTKPLTLAFRLFGNIIAGEILLEVLHNLSPYGPPVIWLGFSFGIGLIQAFIFTVLSTSYIGSVIKDGH